LYKNAPTAVARSRYCIEGYGRGAATVAKLQDAQNRLGFLVAMAKSLAAENAESWSAFTQLSAAGQQLERARLARQDTLCRKSMPKAERHWLETNRSMLARHWNLLTGLTADQLSYAP
jgi:hypothetical protein